MGRGILTLLSLCAAAALCETVLPGDTRKGTKEGFRFLTALLVTVLLLEPILPASGAGIGQFFSVPEENTEEEEAAFRRAVAKGGEAQLREYISSRLEKDHGVKKENAEIRVSFDGSGELARVSVFLSGGARLKDPAEIEKALSDLFSCEVEVR